MVEICSETQMQLMNIHSISLAQILYMQLLALTANNCLFILLWSVDKSFSEYHHLKVLLRPEVSEQCSLSLNVVGMIFFHSPLYVMVVPSGPFFPLI